MQIVDGWKIGEWLRQDIGLQNTSSEKQSVFDVVVFSTWVYTAMLVLWLASTFYLHIIIFISGVDR